MTASVEVSGFPIDGPIEGAQMSRQFHIFKNSPEMDDQTMGRQKSMYFAGKELQFVLNLEASQGTSVSHNKNHEVSSFLIWLSQKLAGACS